MHPKQAEHQRKQQHDISRLMDEFLAASEAVAETSKVLKVASGLHKKAIKHVEAIGVRLAGKLPGASYLWLDGAPRIVKSVDGKLLEFTPPAANSPGPAAPPR